MASPGNDVIFQALSAAISHLVPTRPGASAQGRDQIFTANGGAFYYEFLPHCLSGGLVEGATPECRGPAQVLLYQRAQEALLRQALPLAQARLAAHDFPGELGLLKNCRDAEGNIYGAQENYEVDVARGPALLLYRACLILLLPVLAVMVVLAHLVVLLFLAALVAGSLAALCVRPWRQRLLRFVEGDGGELELFLGRFQLWMIVVFTWPVATPFAVVLQALAFRRFRRHLMAFLATRSLLAGSGSVFDGRRFALSEKAPAICTRMRLSVLPEDRPIFDTGNLIKVLCAPFNLKLRPLATLFRRRQRLQLGIGDSNRAQEAEYLKVGTTALILDMIEDGFLDDAPRLKDPVAALHTAAADVTFEAPLEVAGGDTTTALEVQRYYHDQARRYLRSAPATSLEAEEVVRRWGEILDALAAGETASLVGRLDWVTKRFVLESCGGEDSEAVLKTLDLRYHELEDGYFDRLERAGETATLVDEDEVRRAILEPPEDTPAFVRGRLIRSAAASGLRALISWDSATIGRRLRGKVVPFRRPPGKA